jgi:NADH-quinone oxidoreductase subunit A
LTFPFTVVFSLQTTTGRKIALSIPVSDAQPLWPLAVFFAASVLIVAVILALSYVLGERHHERATAEPYESGIAATGTARIRFDVKFYLVGMLFLLFDLEAVFLYAWAVSIRETGWLGYAEAAVFIGILAVALVYLWRLGALDWGKKKPTRGHGDRGTGRNS